MHTLGELVRIHPLFITFCFFKKFWRCGLAANVDLALEEEKKAFKEYLLSKNVSDKSANVALSKAFGIWKLKDRETFEALMKSDNFEKDARALLVEIYKGNEKKASAYYSELRRYYIYYLEKRGLPVPAEIQKAKPGRKPGTKNTAKKETAKAAEKKKPGRKPGTKNAAKKETAKAAEKKKPGRKPAAKKTGAKAAVKTTAKKTAAKKTAAKKTTAKKTAGRKPATKAATRRTAAQSTASNSNAALVKAINELNKTLAPIAKLAQKLK